MNVISYTNPGAATPQEKQTFRMYFQSVIGNIKETLSDAFGPWQSCSLVPVLNVLCSCLLAVQTNIHGRNQRYRFSHGDVVKSD